jgi:glucose-6-phosphate-specific signal transduction histidine kinase
VIEFTRNPALARQAVPFGEQVRQNVHRIRYDVIGEGRKSLGRLVTSLRSGGA